MEQTSYRENCKSIRRFRVKNQSNGKNGDLINKYRWRKDKMEELSRISRCNVIQRNYMAKSYKIRSGYKTQ